MDTKGKERGILKLEPRPRVIIDTSRAELTPQGSCDHPPCSPQPSVDRLSVTWAEPGSMSSSGVNLFHLPSETPLSNEVKFSPTAGDGSEDEDYSASLSAVLRQRRASVRRSRKIRPRRPSSPFLGDENRPRRRSSVFTTSSGDTAISMEDGQSAVVTQEQIFENIHLHKEVLGSVKQQPLGMRRKLKIVHQATAYIKRHEGQLQERLAQSKSTRDIYARFNILMASKWQQLKREAANMSNLLIPWELRIKEIESHFGSVVASYFTFLRWLFWVNLVIAFILLVFVIVPEYLTANPDQDGERKKIMEGEEANATNLLTLWEFEGRLKYSPIFYGFYSNIERAQYRMPLAYFLTGLAVYIYSFVAILRKMAENSRMSKLSEKDDECIFSWKLFTGWDFMIGNTETAHNRIASVILGFKEALLEEAEKKKDLRKWRIISLRCFVNICVVILLAISAYAVVTVVSRSDDGTKVRGWWRENETTIVVTVISITFPVFFELLGFLEHYHPRKQLRLQLARIMLLNLLNLYSLIFALFSKIDGMSEALLKLKPGLLVNATVSNVTLNISEPISITIPNSCIQREIPCSECNDVLTSPLTQETILDTVASTSYSINEDYPKTSNRIKKLVRRKRDVRNTFESSTTEKATTLDTITETRRIKEMLKMYMATHPQLTNSPEKDVDEDDDTYDDNDDDEEEEETEVDNEISAQDTNDYKNENILTSTIYNPTINLIDTDLGTTDNGELLSTFKTYSADTTVTTDFSSTNNIDADPTFEIASVMTDARTKLSDTISKQITIVKMEGPSTTNSNTYSSEVAMDTTTDSDINTSEVSETSMLTVLDFTTDSNIDLNEEPSETTVSTNLDTATDFNTDLIEETFETTFSTYVDTATDFNTDLSENIFEVTISTHSDTETDFNTNTSEETLETTISTNLDATIDSNLNKQTFETTTVIFQDTTKASISQTNEEIPESTISTDQDTTKKINISKKTSNAITSTGLGATTVSSTTTTVATPVEMNKNINDISATSTSKSATALETTLKSNTTTPVTAIESKRLCPNISFNCTPNCGNQNVTQVLYMSNCKVVKAVCYVTTCSADANYTSKKNITDEAVDTMYLDDDNRRMYNLTIRTRKKLLKLCWETMFGQELVKLTMMDLVFVLLGTLFMDFFRALFVRYMNRCWCWDLEKKFPEYGDFKIAENILHLINNQGMVWMGMFFSPGLVVLNVFKLMIMMYLRSWTVMTCNVPHAVVFRVSKSNNFYLALLLTMLFLCVLPVGYTIVWVKPSWHCGPFSEYDKIYYILTINIYKLLPNTLNFALEYIASPAIVIPLLVLLILIIYYLTSLTNSLREANNDLKIQLRRERTEERRKMFQLADTRRRAGSSAMDNTPFARWKKALPSLPMSKSIDSDDRKTLNCEEMNEPMKTSKKKGGIFAKIVGMALDKKTDGEMISEIEIASPSPNNIDDETDTDFHETLPKEVLKIKDITIIRPEPKKRNSVEFKTDEDKKTKIDDKHFRLKLAKVDDRTEKDAMGEKQRKEVKEKPKIAGEIPKIKSADRKMSEKQTSQSSTQSKQSDSIGSVIPVITISTTESDEEILSKKNKRRREQDTDNIETKVKKTPDLKSLRRQSSVESISEHKVPKDKKQEDGHKYQYSL